MFIVKIFQFYICVGWVVRKMLDKLLCTTCRCACVMPSTASPQFTSAYQLILLKNNGGLVLPSAAVLKVITSAERHLRHLSDLNKLNRKISALQLTTLVLLDCGSADIFGLGEHIYNTADGIHHHGTTLVRNLVSTYFTLRQHHIARLHTQHLQGTSIRQSLTKTIIFKGQ